MLLMLFTTFSLLGCHLWGLQIVNMICLVRCPVIVIIVKEIVFFLSISQGDTELDSLTWWIPKWGSFQTINGTWAKCVGEWIHLPCFVSGLFWTTSSTGLLPQARNGMEWNIELRPMDKHWDPLGHSVPSWKNDRWKGYGEATVQQ